MSKLLRVTESLMILSGLALVALDVFVEMGKCMMVRILLLLWFARGQFAGGVRLRSHFHTIHDISIHLAVSKERHNDKLSSLAQT
jgi:hypothetical protein